MVTLVNLLIKVDTTEIFTMPTFKTNMDQGLYKVNFNYFINHI